MDNRFTATPQQLRLKLIAYLDTLLMKDHIQSRYVLSRYRVKLDLNECLTTKEIGHVIRFLVRDSERSTEELRTLFKPLTSNKAKTAIPKDATSTLDEFFH